MTGNAVYDSNPAALATDGLARNYPRMRSAPRFTNDISLLRKNDKPAVPSDRGLD